MHRKAKFKRLIPKQLKILAAIRIIKKKLGLIIAAAYYVA